MGAPHRPRRGSIAYSPRKRARSEVPRIRCWPEGKGEPRLQGFAGYKVGMTHVVMTDDMPNSLTEGMEITVPVTIVEAPAMRVAAIRAYRETTFGAKAIAEAWTKDLDAEMDRAIMMPKKHDSNKAMVEIEGLINQGAVQELRVITYTLPSKISGVPKKKPDVMECSIGGGDIIGKFRYAQGILGKTISVGEIFNGGDIVDVLAITKGKGTQGPVKRWGITLGKAKHSRAGSVRQIGTLGPWHPHRISWRVPQMGQTGYHQRTEFNKRILQIGKDGRTVTPKGGFLNYGIVRNDYIAIKGSIPGPAKRLIRIRPAVRPKEEPRAPTLSYVSLESKQG